MDVVLEGRDLILEGGSRVRKVRASHQAWTQEDVDCFLEELATCCNVKLAAERARVSTSAAYSRRERDATFRAAWDKAVAMGYADLELMLLERALHGTEKTVVQRDGSTAVMREYSDRVALALLKMHRETAAIAGETVDDQEYEEARERIVARLERLRERSASEESEVETKAARDVVALLRHALRRGSGQALVRR